MPKGLNPSAFLNRHLFDVKKIEQLPTRNGYGDGLVEAGRLDKNVMVLCADLTESTRFVLRHCRHLLHRLVLRRQLIARGSPRPTKVYPVGCFFDLATLQNVRPFLVHRQPDPEPPVPAIVNTLGIYPFLLA